MRGFFPPNTKMYFLNKAILCLMVIFYLVVISLKAQASSLEQAKRLHDRISGVPATDIILNEMVVLLNNGQTIEAAYKAMESPHFYSTTLKLLATPWTNEDQDIFAPLNDYSATVIGIVRDDIDFREILQGDITYIGKSELELPLYSKNNNDHYQALEEILLI